MKSKNHIIVVIAGILLLFSCINIKEKRLNIVSASEIKAQKISINLNDFSQRINFSSFIDTFWHIKLELHKGHPIGNIQKALFDNDLIFLQDDIANSIFVYNKNGKFINYISHKGKGPKEYVSLSDFTIDPENNQIIILSNSQQKYVVYDYNGVFVAKYRYEKNITFASYDRGGKNLVAYNNSWNNSSNQYRYNILFINKDGTIEKYAMPYAKEYDKLNISKTDYFWYSDSLLVYCPLTNNKVYSIYNNTINLLYDFDFGINNINDKVTFHEKDIFNFFASNKIAWYIERFFQTTTHIYFDIHYVNRLPIFIDKRSMNVITTTIGTADDIGLGSFGKPIGCHNGTFINTVEPIEIINCVTNVKKFATDEQYKNYVNITGKRAYNLYLHIDKDDNPLLLMYKMKQF